MAGGAETAERELVAERAQAALAYPRSPACVSDASVTGGNRFRGDDEAPELSEDGETRLLAAGFTTEAAGVGFEPTSACYGASGFQDTLGLAQRCGFERLRASLRASRPLEVGVDEVDGLVLTAGHQVAVAVERDLDRGVAEVGRERLRVRPRQRCCSSNSQLSGDRYRSAALASMQKSPAIEAKEERVSVFSGDRWATGERRSLIRIGRCRRLAPGGSVPTYVSMDRVSLEGLGKSL